MGWESMNWINKTISDQKHFWRNVALSILLMSSMLMKMFYLLMFQGSFLQLQFLDLDPVFPAWVKFSPWWSELERRLLLLLMKILLPIVQLLIWTVTKCLVLASLLLSKYAEFCQLKSSNTEKEYGQAREIFPTFKWSMLLILSWEKTLILCYMIQNALE